MATLSGQRSTEAFLYYWSFCRARRRDWGAGTKCAAGVHLGSQGAVWEVATLQDHVRDNLLQGVFRALPLLACR